MITHFARLQLNTVSIPGVKQFYHEQLQFPIIFESDDEITFEPTKNFVLSFKEADQPIAPAHFAFEVPFSEFDYIVKWLQHTRIALLKWANGEIIEDFETGRNVYFRDGDGNLLEIITHNYVREGILSPNGGLKILYLREIGFPADSVVDFRNFFVEIFDLKLDKVSDNFTFAIGGAAHMVIPSKKRKWIPIAMTALPPAIHVIFGVSNSEFIDRVGTKLKQKGIQSKVEDGQLSFKFKEYRVSLNVTNFSENTPTLLNLPYSQ